MLRDETILIVVDPTAEAHPAVERGMYLAKECGMRVELFVCGFSPQLVNSKLLNADKLERAKHGYVSDQKKLLATLAEPYIADGIDVAVKASWDHPLYEGIIRQVLHSDPRLVIKDTHFHSRLRRTLFTNTDWHLIRSCPAPLWLVRADTDFASPVMLAAVDPMHDNDKPATLDIRLLSEAFGFADELGATVHVFHAYNPFIDPDDPKRIEAAHEEAMQTLAENFQIPGERVHLHAGNTVDLLPKIETDIKASVVVMGAVSRSRLEHAIIGSTAENVLDLLSCDVLIVKPKRFVSPVTFKCAPRGVIYADD
jgi:universal stress protein E